MKIEKGCVEGEPDVMKAGSMESKTSFYFLFLYAFITSPIMKLNSFNEKENQKYEKFQIRQTKQTQC
jgi:hypothetical protein